MISPEETWLLFGAEDERETSESHAVNLWIFCLISRAANWQKRAAPSWLDYGVGG